MHAKIAEVLSGVYKIPLPLPMRPSLVNVYLIDCGQALALVDTGINTPQSLKTLETALRTVDRRVEDLDAIIVTHYHVDHFGASEPLRERSGARVYIHREDAVRARRMTVLAATPITERPESLNFFAMHGFPLERYPADTMRPSWMGTDGYRPVLEPDEFLSDGAVLKIGSRRLKIIWTPGHSDGHCVVYLERERALIAGDHLLPTITPHVGLYPEGAANPLGDFLASQRKVRDLAVDVVLPAHGEAYADLRHRVDQLLEHHRRRQQKMLALVRKQPRTAFEVAEKIFGDRPRPVFHVIAATCETLAHLELSFLEGKARKIEHSDRVLFQAT
jgi:glyoxylase-like metal-dependent hydrolase (beta-lactamase superfamily II)